MAVSISNLSTKFANSSFTYNAISMNVTTGLYEANSKILTLKANGVVKFSVDVNGHTVAAGMNLVPTIQAAFNKANTGGGTGGDIGPPFDQANSAYLIANLAFDKANSANLLAFNTGSGSNTYLLSVISGANIAVGTGANAFTSATIAGANSAVGTGANAFTSATVAGANSAVGAGANAFTSATIAGANTAVGAGANAFSSATISGANSAVGTGANAFTSATIAGANSAVGTGANAFTSATIAGANSAVGTGANAFTSATIAGANTAVGAGANAYAVVVGAAANAFMISVQNGSNTAVGTGANAFTSATIAGANAAVGAGANAYSNATFVKLTASNQTITGNLSVTGSLTVSGNTYRIDANTLVVQDPLIYLAGNNYTSDIVDIGFIANYVNSTGQNVHTGLYREHTDKMYYLFQGYDKEPVDNHIGALSNNMTLAVLNADLRTSNIELAGVNVLTRFTTANSWANSVGVAANAFASATIAGANSAVGTGANAFTSATIAGANSAVGTGANAYAAVVGTSANAFASATIAGANSAVGAGANAFTSATISGANTAVGAGANAFASATIAGANAITTSAFAQANTARTQANTAYDKANAANVIASAAFDKANLSGNSFGTVNANGTLVVSDTTGDTITFLTGNNISIVGDAVNDRVTVGLTNDVIVPGLLSVMATGGDEGGEIQLANALTNSVLSGNIVIDVYQNRLRFFEQSGTNRGAFINLASASAGVGTDLLAATSATDTLARSTANAAFDKANAANVLAFNALPNTSGVSFAGNLNITGNTTSDRIAVGTSISSTYRLIVSGTMTLVGGGYRILSDGNNQNLWRDSTDTTTRLSLGYNATAVQAAITVVNTAAPLVISTSNIERMRLTNTGNVLIGRTAESTVGQNVKLDVGAAVNASSYLVNGTFLGYELLTTLSATGVATQTPTGLTLTGYRMLLFVYDDISHSDGANNRAPTINGQVFGSNRSAASLFYGMVFVTLSNGRGWGCVETDGGNNSTLRNLSLTNANTSFTVGWNGAGNFDGGSIEVYGVR